VSTPRAVALPLAAAVAAALSASASPGEPDRAALAEVARLEDRRAADPAAWAPLLEDDDPLVRRLAARGAGRVRSEDLAAPLLAALVAESEPAVAREQVFALGQLGAAVARPSLLERLDDPDPARRAEVAQALAKLGSDAEAERALAARIDDDAPAVRGEALLALVRLRGRRVAEPAPLAAADARRLLARIVRRLGDDDAGVRWRAAYALAELPLPGRLGPLVAALGADDPAARLFAARGLGRLEGDPEERGWAILARFVQEEDPHVLATLARLLGRLEVAEALDPLLEAAGRAGPTAHHVRIEAIGALVALVRPDDEPGAPVPLEVYRAVLGAFRTALDDDAPAVRAAALTGLATLDPRDGARRVAAFAGAEDAYDRQAAARAASVLPAEPAAPVLGELVADSDPRVATAALASLGELEGAAAAALEAARAAAAVDDIAVAATGLDVLARLGSADDVAVFAAAYDRAGGGEGVEARTAALQSALALATRLREEAAAADDATPEAAELAAAAEAGVGALLERAAGDEAAAVRRAAAGALAELAGEEPPPALPPAEPVSTVDVVPGEDYLRDAPNPRAVLHTSKGPIELELLRDAAPRHVKSFLDLARSGFYDGLPFHRVVAGFVIQGLDPRRDGWGSGGVVLADEINDVRYLAGAVGMPNAGPDTGGCQVFITHCPTPHLDGRYTVFGRVAAGMDVVHAVAVGDVCERVEVRGE